jgi:hypothetical protein
MPGSAEGVHYGGRRPGSMTAHIFVRRADPGEPAAIATRATAASSLTNLDWPWKRALMLDMRVIFAGMETRGGRSC